LFRFTFFYFPSWLHLLYNDQNPPLPPTNFLLHQPWSFSSSRPESVFASRGVPTATLTGRFHSPQERSTLAQGPSRPLPTRTSCYALTANRCHRDATSVSRLPRQVFHIPNSPFFPSPHTETPRSPLPPAPTLAPKCLIPSAFLPTRIPRLSPRRAKNEADSGPQITNHDFSPQFPLEIRGSRIALPTWSPHQLTQGQSLFSSHLSSPLYHCPTVARFHPFFEILTGTFLPPCPYFHALGTKADTPWSSTDAPTPLIQNTRAPDKILG